MQQRNDEHSFHAGDPCMFKLFDGTQIVGRLLYLYTMRVYNTDDKGRIKRDDYRIVNFRCGFEPYPALRGLDSVHVGCGRFSIRALASEERERHRLFVEMSAARRADGRSTCEMCGEEYWRHPFTEHRDWNDEPFLHRLCSGDIVKL